MGKWGLTIHGPADGLANLIDIDQNRFDHLGGAFYLDLDLGHTAGGAVVSLPRKHSKKHAEA